MDKPTLTRLSQELLLLGHEIEVGELHTAIRNAERGGADRFDAFWRLFPKQRKKDKQKCLKKWKLYGFDSIADVIIADVAKRNCGDWEWANGFAPMPATYLNNRRWLDDMIMPETRADLKRYADDNGHSWSGPVPDHLKEHQGDWVDKYQPVGGWK